MIIPISAFLLFSPASANVIIISCDKYILYLVFVPGSCHTASS